MNKAEQFVNNHFRLPENLDKYEQKIQRYTLVEVEDVAEQFADHQLTTYRDDLLSVLKTKGKISEKDVIALFSKTSNEE